MRNQQKQQQHKQQHRYSSDVSGNIAVLRDLKMAVLICKSKHEMLMLFLSCESLGRLPKFDF